MATVEEIIGEEWRSRSTELADWAMDHLVNRRDVWGQYSVSTPTEQRKSGRSYKAMTLPAITQRDVNADRVTLDKLTRHFASRRGRRPQLIGLHAKSKAGTSRWLGIDIDNHSADATSSDDLARRNLNATVGWYKQLQAQGYDPLVFDSNGAGGFHLWVLFREPAPTEAVYAFAMAITSDWRERQLEKLPETFPKRVKADSLGSWFRLPGLHHTRDHHARVWLDDDALDDPWLSGHAAIDVILNCVPGPPPPTSKTERSAVRSKRSVASARNDTNAGITSRGDAEPGDPGPIARRRRHERNSRPKICIDLDGVLAARTGNDTLGVPIDGAVEFTRDLHKSAELIIHTARFSTRRGTPRSASAIATLEKRIERWLDRHGFAWDSINSRVAKPIAVAYVDDRAVSCQPECDGVTAFDRALEAACALAEGKHR